MLKSLPLFSNYNKLTIILWSAFMVLCLNVFSARLVSVYELPKLTVVGLFGFLFSLLLTKRSHIRINIIFLFVLAFVVGAMFFNAHFSISPFRSTFGDKIYSDSYIAIILYLLITFYVVIRLFSQITVLTGMIIGGFVLSIFSLLHAIFLYLLKLTEISYDGRITATVGQPNILGGILATLIPISFFMFLQSKGRARLFYLITLLLISLSTVLTMSRGAFIGLAFAGLVAFFYFVKNKKIKIFVILSIILVFGAIFFAPKPEFDEDIPYLVKRFLSFKSGENIEDMRLEIWKVSLTPISEKPIMGWGNSNFQNVYQRYLDKEVSPQSVFKEVETSHNIIVDLFVEWGVIVAVITILGFVWLLTKSKATIWIKLALIILVTRSMFNITSVSIYGLFFSLLGLIIAKIESRSIIISNKNIVIEPNIKSYKLGMVSKYLKKKPLNTNFGLWPMIFLKSLVIILSLAIFIIIIKINKAEIYEKMATREGDYNKVINLYEKALIQNPYKQSLWNLYTSTLLWGDDQTKFLSKNNIAIDYFNDYRSNFYMANYYLKNSDKDKSIEYFEKAKSLNKRDPKTYHYLGVLYYEKKEYEKALESFTNVIKLDKKNFSDDYIYLADINLKKGDQAKAKEYLKLAPNSWKKDIIKQKLK